LIRGCDRIVTPESHKGSDAFFPAACGRGIDFLIREGRPSATPTRASFTLLWLDVPAYPNAECVARQLMEAYEQLGGGNATEALAQTRSELVDASVVAICAAGTLPLRGLGAVCLVGRDPLEVSFER
jgi:hypothetical protein